MPKLCYIQDTRDSLVISLKKAFSLEKKNYSPNVKQTVLAPVN